MLRKFTPAILYSALLVALTCLLACNEEDSFNAQEQFQQELEMIDQHLNDNNITFQVDSSTLIRYVIHEAGNDTFPEVGDTLEVDYEGMFLDGNKFDSSLDRGNPFTFRFGIGQVIYGWDASFDNFLDEEAEATIYLPSAYAYGRQGQGSIPPNTPLVFDIYFRDILNK